MCKYRLVKVTDHEGNEKPDTLNYIERNYSLEGNIPFLEKLGTGSCLKFVYDKIPSLALRTSTLSSISITEKEVKAVTKNSIYYFRKIEKEIERSERAYDCKKNY